MQIIEDLLADERKRLVTQIIDDLPQHGGCIAIIGELRMGKTVTLQALKGSLPDDPSRRTPLIYLPLKDIQDEDAVYSAIMVRLDQLSLGVARPVVNQRSWEELEIVIEMLASQILSLTIVIDDADLLAEYEWGAKLFRRLTVYLNKNTRVYIILAGTHKLVKWAEDLPGKKGLWEYLARPPIYLRALPLQKLLETLKPTGFAQSLIEMSGGHPFCLTRLTENISDAQPLKFQLDALELAERQYEQAHEWDETFQIYWESFSITTRQLCYLLASNSLGYKRDALKNILLSENTSNEELDTAIRSLDATGVLLQNDVGDRLRLIGIFRSWYQNEIGYIEKVRYQQDIPVITPTSIEKVASLTELIFLPEEKTVLVKRGHFFFRSELGIDSKFLNRYSRKAERLPLVNPDDFLYNLNELTQDLWVAFSKTEWLNEVRSSCQEGRSIRFYFPLDMMGFPFEMLPLDDTGTRRIGTQVPISRQLFEQGRSINREPLSLPLTDGEHLKILVIVAETRNDFWLDSSGKIQPGRNPGEADAPVFSGLRLEDEINVIYEVLNRYSGLIDEVTYLSNQTVQGTSIRCVSPTIGSLETALASQKFDLIHFVGHALFSNTRKGLIMPDGLVTLNRLQRLLEKQEQLRFMYLSCCESGRTATDEFSSNLLGVAQTCIESGVPAVLSMRWQIPLSVSKRLTGKFYPTFFASGNLETATLESIRGLGDDLVVHTAAPILLMH